MQIHSFDEIYVRTCVHVYSFETTQHLTGWKEHIISMSPKICTAPDSKDHGANMGPTWVLSAPGGPHVGPMNLAIMGGIHTAEHKVNIFAQINRFILHPAAYRRLCSCAAHSLCWGNLSWWWRQRVDTQWMTPTSSLRTAAQQQCHPGMHNINNCYLTLVVLSLFLETWKCIHNISFINTEVGQIVEIWSCSRYFSTSHRWIPCTKGMQCIVLRVLFAVSLDELSNKLSNDQWSGTQKVTLPICLIIL